ncbi:MAG: polymorphic toxin-type HINT domain-containing protein, partial [Pseudomonadota bacterium]
RLFSASFPNHGSLIAEHSYEGDWYDTNQPKPIAKTERVWDTLAASFHGAKTVFPFIKSETRINYEDTDIGTRVQFGVSKSTTSVTTSTESLATMTRVLERGETALYNVTAVDWEIVGTPGQMQTTTLDYDTSAGNLSSWLLNVITDIDKTYAADGQGSQTVSTEFTQKPGMVIPESFKNHVGDTELEATTSLTYDLYGNVTSVNVLGQDVASRTTNIGPYLDGRFSTDFTDAEGNTGSALYDVRFGAIKQSTDANGQVVDVTRDSLGRVTQVVADGSTTSYSFSECTSCPTVGSHTAVYYVSITSDVGPDQEIYVDKLGRTIRSSTRRFDNTGFGHVNHHYDNVGRLKRQSMPFETSETLYHEYQYDQRSRLTKEVRPDVSEVTLSYELVDYQLTGVGLVTGLRTLSTDSFFHPLLGTVERKREQIVNALGQLSESRDHKTDGSGPGELYVQTEYKYDRYGNLNWTQVDGDTATESTMTYDAAGNKKTIDEPNTGVTTFDYDALSRLREQTDARGIVVSFDYDHLDRLIERVDDVNGVGATNTWDYDTATFGKGLMASRSAPGFSETYTYDSQSRLQDTTTVLTPTGAPSETFVYSQTYDQYGRADVVTTPDQLDVRQNYNTAGYLSDLERVSDQVSLHTFTSRDAAGRLTGESFNNGLTSSYAYSTLGDLASISTGVNGAVQDLDYMWLSNGLFHEREDLNLGTTETFEYDLLHRLTEATIDDGGPDRVLTTTYDDLGNLLQKTSNLSGDSQITSMGYTGSAGPHALQSVTVDGSAYTLSYDAAGNVESIDTTGTSEDRHFDYDANNLTTRIAVGSDTSPDIEEVFQYGPDGQRFFKQSTFEDGGNTITTYTYYVAGGAYEKNVRSDGTNTDTATKTAITSVVEQRTYDDGTTQSDNLVYLHRDHLGSIDVVTNESGTVIADMSFDPFGERRESDWMSTISSASLDNILANELQHTSRGFTDHEHLDRVGVIHMNGRTYDPLLGRFLSADPFVADPTSSQSFNRYSYVDNTPLSLVDPTGYIEENKPRTPSQLEQWLDRQWENQLLAWGAVTPRQSWYDGAVRSLGFEPNPHGWRVAVASFGAGVASDFSEGLDEFHNFVDHAVQYHAERDNVVAGTIAAAFNRNNLGNTATSVVGGPMVGGVVKVAKVLNTARKAPKPKPNCCFVAGTLVLTDQGYEAIENIEVGDLVLAKNVETGEQDYKPVTQLFVKDREIFELIVVDATGRSELIETTDDHPFYVSRIGFVDTVELLPGDLIETGSNGLVRVDSVVRTGRSEVTYNFEVAEFHTYYATSLEVLVHNCPKGVARYLNQTWHKGTFPNKTQSVRYHLDKHGKGRTAGEYTRDAMDFFERNKHLAKNVTLKDGTPGIKIQTKVKVAGQKTQRVGGYWTQDGKLVTFWD